MKKNIIPTNAPPNTKDGDLKERIYNFVSDTGGGVSFHEIANEFGEGDSSIILRENVIIWSGIPFDVCDSIVDMQRTGRLVLVDTSPVIYLIDGCALNLPIAKQVDKCYKTPHWAPSCINIDKQMKETRHGI